MMILPLLTGPVQRATHAPPSPFTPFHPPPPPHIQNLLHHTSIPSLSPPASSSPDLRRPIAISLERSPLIGARDSRETGSGLGSGFDWGVLVGRFGGGLRERGGLGGFWGGRCLEGCTVLGDMAWCLGEFVPGIEVLGMLLLDLWRAVMAP